MPLNSSWMLASSVLQLSFRGHRPYIAVACSRSHQGWLSVHHAVSAGLGTSAEGRLRRGARSRQVDVCRIRLLVDGAAGARRALAAVRGPPADYSASEAGVRVVRVRSGLSAGYDPAITAGFRARALTPCACMLLPSPCTRERCASSPCRCLARSRGSVPGWAGKRVDYHSEWALHSRAMRQFDSHGGSRVASSAAVCSALRRSACPHSRPLGRRPKPRA